MAGKPMYPYTAKEAKTRGELEVWRENFRANVKQESLMVLV